MLDFIVMLLQLVGLGLLVVMAWLFYWKVGVGALGATLLLVGYLLGRPAKSTP